MGAGALWNTPRYSGDSTDEDSETSKITLSGPFRTGLRNGRVRWGIKIDKDVGSKFKRSPE